MKKLMIFLLAFVLVLPFAACDNADSDVSGAVFSGGEHSDTAVSDDVSSKAEASSEAPVSQPDSSESSDVEAEPKPEFIESFVSIGTVDTKVKATSANSIQLTAIDDELGEEAIILYTYDHDAIRLGDLTDYAVAVFEYDPDLFGYAKASFTPAGEDKEVDFPDDGFVLALHSSRKTYVSRVEDIPADETVFPHGVHLYDGVDYTVKKAETAPEIDGSFSEDEWGEYHIDDIDHTNPDWSYAQFKVNDYYAAASYYTAYDDEYIYLCVVVDSPYHYCPITTANAGGMWQYECIQVKVSSESPDGDYILENFDYVANNTAATEGVVRSYGFAVNDDGETCFYEGGITTVFTGLAGCSRDDEKQLTVYEVAIPFAEFEITPESGMELGLTFSINSTNEEDVSAGVWKNITYRNGGGVIGRNDWTKIPVITLE